MMRFRRSVSETDQLRHFWDLSADLFTIIGFDGKHRRVNAAVLQLLDYTAEELFSMAALDMVHPDDLPAAESLFARLRQGKPAAGEARVVCKDGSIRWLEFSAIGVQAEGLIYAAARDVTGRKETVAALEASEESHRKIEEALRASEEKYRNLVERLPLVVYVDNLDEVSSNIYTSPQTMWMLGYAPDEWANDPDLFVKVIHPDDRERVVEEMTAERPEPYRVEYRVLRPDGRVVWVSDESTVIRDDQGRPLYGQGYLLDITAQKEAEAESRRLEEALRQAQKMEAVGRLASGIAHDFNNLLTAIVGYVELGRGNLAGANPELQTSLEQIGRAADRAADLTRQLLAFGRKQMLDPRVLDLNEVVASVEDMFRRLIGERIALRVSLAPKLGRVKADRGQIEQVLANLAVNARDAMPDGGVLVIETENLELNEVAAARYQLGPGSFVSLRVSDTGAGMDESTLARVFEPFFTTKEQGKGTGLGLATVYGIVRQSGGGITAVSRLGEGTTFTIVLPETMDEASAAQPMKVVELPRGVEKVLVVEDEPAVRQLVCKALERHGYEVLAAPAPAEALERYGRGGHGIDLLVTDVVMPGMGGRELAERLGAVYPALHVLYTTGYTDDPALRPQAAYGALLEKPFSPGDLLRKVREVLDEPAPERADVG